MSLFKNDLIFLDFLYQVFFYCVNVKSIWPFCMRMVALIVSMLSWKLSFLFLPLVAVDVIMLRRNTRISFLLLMQNKLLFWIEFLISKPKLVYKERLFLGSLKFSSTTEKTYDSSASTSPWIYYFWLYIAMYARATIIYFPHIGSHPQMIQELQCHCRRLQSVLPYLREFPANPTSRGLP